MSEKQNEWRERLSRKAATKFERLHPTEEEFQEALRGWNRLATELCGALEQCEGKLEGASGNLKGRCEDSLEIALKGWKRAEKETEEQRALARKHFKEWSRYYQRAKHLDTAVVLLTNRLTLISNLGQETGLTNESVALQAVDIANEALRQFNRLHKAKLEG